MKTRLWKFAVLALAVLMTLSGCSMIEIDEEREAAQTVAEVGGEKITYGEVIDQYRYELAYYASYGETYSYMNANYGTNYYVPSDANDLKEHVLDEFVQDRLLKQKAKELGVDSLTDEKLAELAQEAAEYTDTLVTEYAASVNTEGMDEAAAREAVVAYLAEQGYAEADYLEGLKEAAIVDQVKEAAIADVAVSEEEIRALYDEKVASDESAYSSSSYQFEYSAAGGTAIYWIPEGYRAVKHILLKMTDEQSNALSALEDELTALEGQIADLEEAAGAEATDQPEAEQTSAPEETAQPEGSPAPEATPAPTLADLSAQKTTLEQQIEDKKAEIRASFQPKIDEIMAKLEAGEAFQDLMAEYGEDPGMQSEPGIAQGYYVSAASSMWENAFKEAALGIAAIGGVSEPVLGSNGVHIVYYDHDLTPGAVDYDSIREQAAEAALSAKQEETYAAMYDQWLTAANVKKYPKVLPNE